MSTPSLRGRKTEPGKFLMPESKASPEVPQKFKVVRVEGKGVTKVFVNPKAKKESVLVSFGELSDVQRHAMVKKGLSSELIRRKLARYHHIKPSTLLTAIGLSSKTLDRRKESRLNERHSDAALALIEITEMAERVLGNRDLAEEWLAAPALALDGQRPLDLLTSAPGIAAVKVLLSRIEYGVYA
jgi:putative toxin-antitoxin system antitoxin component (TIGR02293 family)